MCAASKDQSWLARLEKLEFALQRTVHGTLGGDEATARRGMGLQFKDHRRYSPGDDTRRLDWNAWMRLDELLMRETEVEETPRIVLRPDFSASMSIGDSVKKSCARELALCIGAVALLRRMEVYLQPLGTQDVSASFRGRQQLAVWVALLASEAVPTGSVLRPARSSTRAGMAVLLTDLFSREVLDEVRRLVKVRTAVLVVHLRDPADLSPPGGDRVLLVDAEDGTRMEARIDAAARRGWRQAVEEQFSTLTHELQSLGARVAAFNARLGAEEILLDMARRGTLIKP